MQRTDSRPEHCSGRLRLSKKSIDFSDSLPNVSIFGPRSGPKICRCAAQTPANAGFLQTFDSIRRGSRPLVLPLQKRTSFLQTEDFRQAEIAGCRKSPMDFFDSLHNASLFCPRSGPKSCRCAAQTPADTGFLQAFDPIRGGSRPLVLPLQKRTLFLQAGFFDKLRAALSGRPSLILG